MLVSLTKEGFESQYLSIPVSVYAEEPTIVAVEETAVATLVGQAPNLPEEVRVSYSDNTSGMIGLKWADIDASDYAQEGSFTIEARSKVPPSRQSARWKSASPTPFPLWKKSALPCRMRERFPCRSR